MESDDRARVREAEDLRELMRLIREIDNELPALLGLTTRRSALMDAFIPRVVPSFTTYGAYEQPI